MIELGPDDEFPPARLVDVDVQRSGNNNGVEPGLQGFGHEGLEGMGDDGEGDARHVGDRRGPPRRRVDDGSRVDGSPIRHDARDGSIVHLDAGHLREGMDRHARPIDRAGIGPNHGVMPDDPARRVIKTRHDGKSRMIAYVEPRNQPCNLIQEDQPAVHAQDLVDFRPLPEARDRPVGVGQGQVALLGEHDIEVELLGHLHVQLQAFVVEGHTFGCAVIRPDDGRISAARAGPEVSLVHQSDVRDPVPGQVVRRRKTVSARADDHHVIPVLEIGPGPHAPVDVQTVGRQDKISLTGKHIRK